MAREEIWILNPIQYTSFLRNEVKSRASERAARDWANNGGGFIAAEDRAQRHTLALRDVSTSSGQAESRIDTDGMRAKFRDQFRRRVTRGQGFATPYLGCREFSASFAPLDGGEQPIPDSGSLGRMLRELDFEPGVTGTGIATLFRGAARRRRVAALIRRCDARGIQQCSCSSSAPLPIGALTFHHRTIRKNQFVDVIDLNEQGQFKGIADTSDRGVRALQRGTKRLAPSLVRTSRRARQAPRR